MTPVSGFMVVATPGSHHRTAVQTTVAHRIFCPTAYTHPRFVVQLPNFKQTVDFISRPTTPRANRTSTAPRISSIEVFLLGW
eukprot:836207-Prymnesium_polylepis.1